MLVAWLRGAAAAGRPVGGLLPVLLAARGKVPEALGAYQQWAAAPHSAAAGAATPGEATVPCAWASVGALGGGADATTHGASGSFMPRAQRSTRMASHSAQKGLCL